MGAAKMMSRTPSGFGGRGLFFEKAFFLRVARKRIDTKRRDSKQHHGIDSNRSFTTT